jgi:hypothetical protein
VTTAQAVAVAVAVLVIAVVLLVAIRWRRYVTSRSRYDLVVQPGRFAELAQRIQLAGSQSGQPATADGPPGGPPPAFLPPKVPPLPRTIGDPFDPLGKSVLGGSLPYGALAGASVLESWSQEPAGQQRGPE